MHRPHSVLIDHREQGSTLALRLLGDPAWTVAFARLDSGDYLIDDRILIERKTLSDLAASIKDGRLFRQATRMAAAVKQRSPGTLAAARAGGGCGAQAQSRKSGPGAATRGSGTPFATCAFLIEGSAAELRDSKMTGASLRAALASVSLFFGIPVLRTTNAAESAQLLQSIANQNAKIAQGGLPRMGARPKGKRGLQLHVLQGLPGIGPERAALLLDHFGTVKSVISAGAEELRAVPGIGPVCARKIAWSVAEETAGYTAIPAPGQSRIAP